MFKLSRAHGFMLLVFLCGMMLFIRYSEFPTGSAWMVIGCLTVFTMLLEYWKIPLPRGNNLSLNSIAYLSALFIYGISTALWVICLTNALSLLWRRKEVLKVMLNFAVYTLMVSGAYYGYVLWSGEMLPIRYEGYMAIIGSMLLYALINILLVGVYQSIAMEKPILEVFHDFTVNSLTEFFVTILPAMLFAIVLDYQPIIGSVSFLVLVALVNYNFRKYYSLFGKFEHISAIACTDEVTGLYNHRYFQETLESSLSEAVSEEQPLSVIFLDLDYFKKYNDTFGHPAGDKLLKEMAEILRSNFRAGDVVARYGGEEFVVIASGVEAEDAYRISDRVRNYIEQYPFYGREEMPLGRLTVSCGIASYPQHGTSKQTLIKAADTALYEAKSKGRNRVCIYNPTPHEADRPAVSYVDLSKELLGSLKTKPGTSYEHSLRVSEYMVAFAEWMGMDEETRERLRYGACLHDIGKLEIPSYILNKCEPLTEGEREMVNKHVIYGKELVAQYYELKEFLPMVELHHERFDGTGYPHGLTKEEIPREVRMLSICEAFDRMTLGENYQRRTGEQAFAELRRCAGTQFDPELVESFIEMMLHYLQQERAVLPIQRAKRGGTQGVQGQVG